MVRPVTLITGASGGIGGACAEKLAREGLLDDQTIYAVLAETKPNQQEQLKFKREELRKYFPSGYTEEQMRRDIIKGLELLKRQRERNRDAR